MKIIPFLGWYLHAHTEDSSIDGRMTVDELKAAMLHFQRVYGKPESVVDALFVGASERFWALTSKTVDVYEFEVLSLREYFAARFLFNNAGEDDRRFDSAIVLRELLRRPYWLNTARFYGGNAHGNDIYTLTAGIEEELHASTAPAPFLTAWALLIDGVFQQRPREARKVLTAVCSDQGISVLLSALDRRDIPPLRSIPAPLDDGPDPTWSRLTSRIEQNPHDAATTARVRALRDLLPSRVPSTSGGTNSSPPLSDRHLNGHGCKSERTAKLAPGAPATGMTSRLLMAVHNSLLDTGLVAPSGSALETALLEAVLDGECPSVTSIRSTPAQIAVALSPSAIFTASRSGFTAQSEPEKRRRAAAITRLRRSAAPYAATAEHRSFVVRQHGNTTPWIETASALFEHSGACWLASEIAIIGAASPFALSYVHRPGTSAFGAGAHPSELLARLRRNSNNLVWWHEYLEAEADDLGKASWALALWCVASTTVLSSLLPTLDSTIRALPERRRRTLLRAAEQVTKFGSLRGRDFTASTESGELTRLIQLRNATAQRASTIEPTQEMTTPPTLPSLLSVARAGQWLKVDSTHVYR